MRLCPYPQDCTLSWIYGMQINYITLGITASLKHIHSVHGDKKQAAYELY
jgi:hypothetical protein